LHDEVDKWRAYANSLQTLTNQTAAAPPPARPAQPAASELRLAPAPGAPASSGATGRVAALPVAQHLDFQPAARRQRLIHPRQHPDRALIR